VMFPVLPGVPNPIAIFAGFASSSSLGWAWDKVVQGVFTWIASGLLVLIEWVWGLLDSGTSPHLTDGWFVNGTAAALVPVALFLLVAMMLLAGIQAALSGRPELIVEAVTGAVRAVAGMAFTVVAADTLVRFADVVAATVWVQARPNTRQVLDSITQGVLGGQGWGSTFLGPLALLIGMVGMLVTALLLFTRSAMLYFVAAFASLVWSSSVLPMFRGGIRRMVHLAVGLILAKPAIVISLAVGMQLIAASPSAGDQSGSDVAQMGTMLSGFFCFAVAALSPWVVFKLLPAAEGAAAASGVAGGWARSGVAVAQAAMMAKTLGASKSVSAATKTLPAAVGGGFGPPGGGGSGNDHAPSGSVRRGGDGSLSPSPSGTGVNFSSTATPAESDGAGGVPPATGAGRDAGRGGPARPAARSERVERSPRRVVIARSGDRGDGGAGGVQR
jgi:hypothetical protein